MPIRTVFRRVFLTLTFGAGLAGCVESVTPNQNAADIAFQDQQKAALDLPKQNSSITLDINQRVDAMLDLEPPPRMILQRQSFDNLPGWQQDNLTGFMAAMTRSCEALSERDGLEIMSPSTPLWGTVNDWRQTCKALPKDPEISGSALRSSIEAAFTPWRISASDVSETPEADRSDTQVDESIKLESSGLFTGYFEPTLRGSLRPTPPYVYPLYPRPSDLVEVDLGGFRKSLIGSKIFGRIENGTLVPYYNRAAINRGALKDGPLPIAWVDNDVDLFFLHIQGSGVIELGDGTELRVGYAGQNGHAYYAIGRHLIENEILPLERISMQSIRHWLLSNPDETQTVMEKNPSYIFFRELHGDGPIGSQGVPLVPLRSIAIDKSLYPLGAPFWLDIEGPHDPGNRIRRLTLAQDTGGAINGVVRADLFWGRGAEAKAAAGRMRSQGSYWILAPNSLTSQIETSAHVLK